MKRPWTALAPCPLAKELIPIHPRKVYYYLTTHARQPIPESSDDVTIPGIEGKAPTPSVSSVDDDEDSLGRQRSPSPEVDLSSPDFEEGDIDLDACGGSGSARHSPEFLTIATRAWFTHIARLLHLWRAMRRSLRKRLALFASGPPSKKPANLRKLRADTRPSQRHSKGWTT